MGSTRTPILLVYAESGVLVPPSAVGWYASRIRNLETAFVGQGLHFMQEDQPVASDARCPIGCDGTRGSSSRHIAMKFSAACSSWLVLSPHCRLAEKRLNCTTVQRRRRSSNSSGSTSPARMRCSRLKACSRGSWRRPTRERRNSRTEPVDGGKFSIEGTRNDLLLMVTGKIISLALPLPHVGSHHGLTDCRARREPALS